MPERFAIHYQIGEHFGTAVVEASDPAVATAIFQAAPLALIQVEPTQAEDCIPVLFSSADHELFCDLADRFPEIDLASFVLRAALHTLKTLDRVPDPLIFDVSE